MSVYTPGPRLVATLDKVCRALRGLGFNEREARHALDAVTANATEPTTSTAGELLRAARHALAPVVVHGRVSCRV